MSSHEDQGGAGGPTTLALRTNTTQGGGDVTAAPTAAQQPTPTDPKLLRVLVVDSKASSRTAVCSLLRDCEYQVTAVRTSAEALQYLLTGQQQGAGQHDESAEGRQHNPSAASHDPSRTVDLVIKEHEPPAADAGRLLRKMARSELLRKTPVVVMSSQDEREVVMNCLTLGAIDYLVKPLRHNELRHIWTRVWWWRRSGLGAPIPMDMPPATMRRPHDLFARSYQSSESKETKCDDEEEPTSKEGSAPDGNNGSNGNGHGSNGSKDGNGTSRVEAKPHGTGNGNGNGSSDNKNGHHGSNGNGASTTLAVERNGAHPLAHTAEGRAPQGLAAHPDTQTLNKVATGRSLACPGDVYNTPPASSSRKRPFSKVAEVDETPNGGNTLRAGAAHHPAVAEVDKAHTGGTTLRAGAAHQPTRAQPIHASGGSGAHMEVVASVSGIAHGSASRTAHGGTTGGSGADPTGTASVAHFAPHHVQASGAGSLTHSDHLPHWSSLAAAGLQHHLLSQQLGVSLPMYAHASPTVSGPNPELHPGMNPMAASNFLAMQLNQQLTAPPEQVGPTLEGCSSGGVSRGTRPGPESAGAMPGFGHHPNALLAQYLQAFQQASMGPLGAVQNHVLQAQLPGAQAAMAAAWAAGAAGAPGLVGGLSAGGAPLFPNPHLHHPHSLLHQHVTSSSNGTSHPLSAMASNGPAALQLAMQQQLLANPALSMAAAAAAAGMPHSPGSGMLGPGPPPGLSMAMQQAGMTGSLEQSASGRTGVPTGGHDPTNSYQQLMLATMGGMMMGQGVPQAMVPPGAAGLGQLATGGAPGVSGQPGSMVPHPQHAQHAAMMAVAEQAGGPRRRRALALDKYRMKRKNLKFGSAIRYETRKVQAQSRPRIKGQFAKAMHTDASKMAHSGPGGTGGVGSTGVAGVDEDGDEDMQGDTRPAAEDEEEEYDHGVDEDENDIEDAEDEAVDGCDGQVQHASSLPPSLGTAQVVSGTGLYPRRSNRHPGRPHARGKSRMGSLASADWSRPPGEPAGQGNDGTAGVGPGCEPGMKEGQAGGDELCEDEEDVVDSLRELKEGHRGGMSGSTKHHHYRSTGHMDSSQQHTAHVASTGQAPTNGQAPPDAPEGASATSSESGEAKKPAALHPATLAGPQTSLSMGSQSGLAASKGSHGRTSQRCAGLGRVVGGTNTGQAEADAGHAVRGDSSGGQLGAGGAREGRGDNRDADCMPMSQRVSSHGREQSARTGERSSHADAHGSNVANTSNGKNGSDSGSNSPDENGNGGSGSGNRHGGHAGGQPDVDQGHGSGGHGSTQQQQQRQ